MTGISWIIFPYLWFRRTPSRPDPVFSATPRLASNAVGVQICLQHSRLCSLSNLHTSGECILLSGFKYPWCAEKLSHLLGSKPFCCYNPLFIRKFHLEVPQLPHSSIFYVTHTDSLSLPLKHISSCVPWHCHHSARQLPIPSNRPQILQTYIINS